MDQTNLGHSDISDSDDDYYGEDGGSSEEAKPKELNVVQKPLTLDMVDALSSEGSDVTCSGINEGDPEDS
jgi:hypothetical protein